MSVRRYLPLYSHSFPACLEAQHAIESKGIKTLYRERFTDIRDLSILPRFPWSRHLGCNDTTVRSGESICDQEWVAAELLEFIIGEIWSIAGRYDPLDELMIYFFLKRQGGDGVCVL